MKSIYQKWLLRAIIIAVAGVIILLIGALIWEDPVHPFMFLGYFLLFCAVGLKWYIWRCPSCKHSFSMRARYIPQICPYCGCKIQEDQP